MHAGHVQFAVSAAAGAAGAWDVLRVGRCAQVSMGCSPGEDLRDLAADRVSRRTECACRRLWPRHRHSQPLARTSGSAQMLQDTFRDAWAP